MTADMPTAIFRRGDLVYIRNNDTGSGRAVSWRNQEERAQWVILREDTNCGNMGFVVDKEPAYKLARKQSTKIMYRYAYQHALVLAQSQGADILPPEHEDDDED